jgi:ribulose-bisphosphate carboxylase large chain
MSSENLEQDNADFFLWQSGSAADSYVLATYVITTPVGGEQAAIGLAREQSICATHLNDMAMPPDIQDFCARVMEVVELSDPAQEIASLYFLNTPVYGPDSPAGELRRFKTIIAYPLQLFGNSLTRLWNSVFGEVHRLGYLSSAALVDLKLPATLANNYAGPKFGAAGLREKLGVSERPLFCRSMRPASGLTTDAMLQLNESVLTGGFDIIKDDELTYDSERSPFADRVRRMVDMKCSVEDKTGEAKLYFANIIDDFSTSLAMAEQAAELGADGVLLSASVQGISFIGEIARRTDLIILSHNSCGDALTRADSWGASDAVMARLQRAAGADLVVSPGPFATRYQEPAAGQAFLEACRDNLGACTPVMPIIQGGKQPTQLAQYTADVGSTDYMIIAATWLDNHPGGIGAGARAFRDAWDELAQDGNKT